MKAKLTIITVLGLVFSGTVLAQQSESQQAWFGISMPAPLYHTRGEVTEVISVPGLERMARFMVYFVKRVDAVEAERLN